MGINENNGLPKNELITKIEAISVLYNKALSIKSKIDNFTPIDNYERKVIVPIFPGEYENVEERKQWETETVDHEEEDAVKQMMDIYDGHYSPKKPVKPVLGKEPKFVTNEVDKLKSKLGCLPIVGIVVGVISLFTAIFTGGSDALTSGLNWVITVLCVGVIGYYYFKFFKAKQKDADVLKAMQRLHKENVAHETEEYENAVRIYESECTLYKLRRQDFIDEYTAWREAYLKSLAEEESIRQRLEADRQAAVIKIEEEEFAPALKDLEEHNNLIAKEYLPAIDVIIDLLKSGRADTLKEAINRYEEIVYRERQLQLQREQEEQRRREEELRRQDEERRYQEQMEFQQQQERQRQHEVKQQLKMQEQQHKEEMEFQKKLEQDRKREAQASRQKRCVWCAHKSTCRQQYYDGAYNCTGFTPKS